MFIHPTQVCSQIHKTTLDRAKQCTDRSTTRVVLHQLHQVHQRTSWRDRKKTRKQGNKVLKWTNREDESRGHFKSLLALQEPKRNEYAFFSSAHGTFSGTDHMLEHKMSEKCMKIEIVTAIWYIEHNKVKSKVNHKKKHGREKHGNKQKTKTFEEPVCLMKKLREKISGD